MRVGMIDTQAIRKRWDTVGSKLDERGQRVFASGEVRAAGWGGLAACRTDVFVVRQPLWFGRSMLTWEA
jgi:hypothetical protein